MGELNLHRVSAAGNTSEFDLLEAVDLPDQGDSFMHRVAVIGGRGTQDNRITLLTRPKSRTAGTPWTPIDEFLLVSGGQFRDSYAKEARLKLPSGGQLKATAQQAVAGRLALTLGGETPANDLSDQ